MEQEPTTRLPRVVSIIGLPGAGKTTLTRELAQRLGWQSFVLGDALRQQAAEDPNLHSLLNRGELAPESTVTELVVRAIHASQQSGLVLDGFPRHGTQLKLASELLGEWPVLFLDVPRDVAVSRLLTRWTCGNCGTMMRSSWKPTTMCPNCRHTHWARRPEDNSPVMEWRMSEADRRLSELLRLLSPSSVVHLDARESLERVAECAIARLPSAGS